MLQSMELLDVADSDFLSSDDQLDDEESECSESEIERYFVIPTAKNRLFGRKKPLHVVLGAGLAADIMLWRDKNVSASILAGLSIIWFIFEGLGYNLIAFFCHSALLLLATLFLWASFGPAANLPPLEFTDIFLPERLLADAAVALRFDIIQGFRTLGDIALGQDLKQFLFVTVTLWGFSAVGARVTFLTSLYTVSVILLIVPMVYEKYEDIIDVITEKVLIELNNQYAAVKKMVLRELHAAIIASEQSRLYVN
ncbi:reticulon-like protein B3 [Prosopis cineraria]|uniref:reticulon-like protein B3 n=1 Tax=Prosopis cineraria TaxID=364024 RepID=UPI00241080D2|nr:reticulon-like protein B3 [Prosopis cineraria]XP_054796406.1 reticulon-like protein B3 [Prosopis cineraria]XP_054796407.1 reticulon-like protein B3 [Prosopis cineraria]XP_054796408.1 reticulon-like protein B3 [Prosopis cineraria]